MKQPVTRQKSMFAPVKGSADCYTHSGFNTNPAKPKDAQPELCHGSGELNLSSAMVGQNAAGKSKTKSVRPVEKEHNPVDITSKETDITTTVSVDDLRAYLKEVGMTQKDFSRFTRTPYDTVRGWFRDLGAIRGSAVTVLVMLRRDKTLAATCRATGWEPLW